MKGLSGKEVEMMANLEFQQKQYFTPDDIRQHFKSKKQMTNTIFSLKKKGRIIRLNRRKYFLVPIKARLGKWSDHSAIIADEMLDGKGYYIGGWFAANYWRLTTQIPFQLDIYTTKKQGKKSIMNTRFVFHRTSKKSLERSVEQKIKEHSFKVLNKEEAKKWVKWRD